MNPKEKKIFLFSCLVVALLIDIKSLCLVIGSNTSVIRQEATTFPASAVNQITGFIFMEQGFTLQDNTTTCSFNGLFPMAGPIQLNGGSFYLQQDLDLQPSLTIINGGSIFGNNMTLSISTVTDFLVPSTAINYFSQKASFNAGSTVTSIAWSYDNNFIVYASNATLTKTVGVLSYSGNSLVSLVTNTSLLSSINVVRFHPSTYYIAVGVASLLGVTGIQIWQFNSSNNTLTAAISTAGLLQGFQSVAWHPSGNFLATTKAVGNGTLSIFPFNSSTGALGTEATTALPASATFNGPGCIDWSPDGSYLAVGVSNNTATELQIYYFNGTSLTFTLGAELGITVDSVSWSSTGSFIAVGLAGGTNQLLVYQYNIGNGTLNNVTGVVAGANVNAVHWNSNPIWLGAGTNAGASTEVDVYQFNSGISSLILNQGIQSTANINDLRWSPSGMYLATGDSSNLVNVYNFKASTLSLDSVVFNNVNMRLSSNLVLRAPTIFQGNCIITGNNNTLGFDVNGSLVVDAGASLMCNHITMTQVAGKITMVDMNSSLTLSNSLIELDNDVTFTQGYLNFVGSVQITGTNKFTFQSSRAASIASYSTLLMDNNMTFSYDSKTASGSLWSMTDQTSVWKISNVTLHSTTTGLQLTKGTLIIDGNCIVQSEATTSGQGIKFGDGINANNDLNIELLAGSGLSVTSGFLVYNNVGG